MIMSQNVPRLHRPVLVLGSTNRKNSGEERVLTAESVPAEWGLGWGGSGPWGGVWGRVGSLYLEFWGKEDGGGGD